MCERRNAPIHSEVLRMDEFEPCNKYRNGKLKTKSVNLQSR